MEHISYYMVRIYEFRDVYCYSFFRVFFFISVYLLCFTLFLTHVKCIADVIAIAKSIVNILCL